jgi:hypothetical protein
MWKPRWLRRWLIQRSTPSRQQRRQNGYCSRAPSLAGMALFLCQDPSLAESRPGLPGEKFT